MYKWPQGRVIRTVCLLLLALIVTDLAYNGAYGPLALGFGADGSTKQIVLGSFFATLALASLVIGLVAIGFHHNAVEFLIEVEQEMTKVEWPTRANLIRSTIVIFIATALLAGLIFTVDLVNYNFVLKWLPSLFHQAFGA